MHPSGDDALVAALAAAARALIDEPGTNDVEQMLLRVVRAAVALVPGADAGGVTLFSAGRLESRAPVDDSVVQLDRLQAELGEGPCVTALTDTEMGSVVLVDDLQSDADRWPTFAARAEPLGFRSILSTQLSANGGVHAALNLYGSAPKAFDRHAQAVASLFGVQAALLLYGVERAAHLETALGSRDLIGQAKGILMERYAVDADQAFQMLVQSSQDTNMKLTDVSRWLTTDGRRTGPPDERRRPPRPGT